MLAGNGMTGSIALVMWLEALMILLVFGGPPLFIARRRRRLPPAAQIDLRVMAALQQHSLILPELRRTTGLPLTVIMASTDRLRRSGHICIETRNCEYRSRTRLLEHYCLLPRGFTQLRQPPPPRG